MFVVGVNAVAVNVGAFGLQFIVTDVGLTVPFGAVVFIAMERVCVAVQVLVGCVTRTVYVPTVAVQML